MIITIGRQHGSNGHDIARKLAKELSLRCFDKEIVDEAAAHSNFSRDVLDSFDEKRVSTFVMPSNHYSGMLEGFQINLKAANAQFDVMRKIAEKGDCIFVGRCADYVLRNRPDLVKVFIMADRNFRIKTIMERKGLDEAAAKKLIREVDKDRSSYYRYYTDQVWGEAGCYNLCIDSSQIGVDGAVEVIKAYIAARK